MTEKIDKEKIPDSCPTHCCIIHGCKYGKPDCVVVNRKTRQAYLCEDCRNGGQEIIDKVWEERISLEEYQGAKIKEIQEAYVWIRENNSTIPDDVLDLMKNSAIRSVKSIGWNNEEDWDSWK